MTNEPKTEKQQAEEARSASFRAGAGLWAGQSLDRTLAALEEKFRKPPTYNRKLYEDPQALRAAKNQAFQQGDPKDPYTGNLLKMRKQEAKAQYGADWQKHLAEVDHTQSVHKVFQKYKDNPWITNDDIKEAVNQKANLQITNRSFNNAKRDRSNTQMGNNQDYRRDKGVRFTKGGKKQALEDEAKAQKAIDWTLKKKALGHMGDAFLQSGAQAAEGAALMTACLSGAGNVVAVIKGEKTTEEALRDLVRDTAASGCTAFALGGSVTVIARSLSSASSPLVQNLVKAGLPGKVVAGVMAVGGTLLQYGQGKITTAECITQLGNTGCAAVWTGYATAAGQALIPIPFVGALVGSLVGGALYGTFAGQFMAAAAEARAARKRYETIARITAENIARLREERASFQAACTRLFQERGRAIQEGYDQFVLADLEGDFDQMAAGLNRIAGAFGQDLGIHSQEEFENLMEDDTKDFVL